MRFRVKPLSVIVHDISGIGTLQSSIVDFHTDIVNLAILGPHPVIVDVGANIGQFVNAAKLFYPSAKVICFEPDPETFSALVTNTADLANVERRNLGLGARTETLTFYRHQLSVMSSFRKDVDANKRHRDELSLEVRRLDDVLDPTIHPDLLKIDVEGFERQVLEGAWETVRRSRYLLIELSLSRGGSSGNLELLRTIADRVPGASAQCQGTAR
jgi:FkbM family methyltransferase